MKRQVRIGVFETNSSSTHSLCICSKKDYDAWRCGNVLFDSWNEKFVKSNELTNEQKIKAAKKYENNRDKFQMHWEDLSDDLKEEYYAGYAIDEGIVDEDLKKYDDYMKDDYLEIFEEEYTTEHGDKIVAFGKYGYEG